MFKKTFFFFFFSYLFIFLLIFNSSYFFQFFFSFFNMSFDMFYSCSLSFNFSMENFIFLYMLLFVVMMVCIFGESYMDSYNNKKFFLLMLIFIFSMIFFCMSGSILILMLGWDGLGISSLLLIMFYPNKTSMYNSYMTFFYNRLGDFFMILVMIFLLVNPIYFLFILNSDYILMLMFLLVICSFSKSAQFPLSSWLPAAMSAPTPISAMVHSSTLVTAGIMLFWKMYYYYYVSMVEFLICSIFILTFILGGFLGFMEKDVKKVVAFSTMSQISMILFFLVAGFLFISLLHMLYHSIFKTLLFCSCGLIFSMIFSDQNSMSFYTNKIKNSSFFFFLTSIFCMSGLPLSTSFFSKDYVLEFSFFMNKNLLYLFLLIGSIFTILYSSKIFKFLYNKSSYSSYNLKNSIFFMFWIFSFFCISYPYILQNFIFFNFIPSIKIMDLILIFIIIIFPFLSYMKLNYYFNVLNSEIFFSKFLSFGMLGKMLLMDKMNFFYSEEMILKSSFFFFFNNNFKFKVLSFLYFMILFFLIVM